MPGQTKARRVKRGNQAWKRRSALMVPQKSENTRLAFCSRPDYDSLGVADELDHLRRNIGAIQEFTPTNLLRVGYPIPPETDDFPLTGGSQPCVQLKGIATSKNIKISSLHCKRDQSQDVACSSAERPMHSGYCGKGHGAYMLYCINPKSHAKQEELWNSTIRSKRGRTCRHLFATADVFWHCCNSSFKHARN
ncbi:hypothetical protein BX600DRAFT_96711 [Xylariales sp. PMI_506]|nr:hypothetical protein BX600DRAFT_96711 [Xylariales sp. PMI_506]